MHVEVIIPRLHDVRDADMGSLLLWEKIGYLILKLPGIGFVTLIVGTLEGTSPGTVIGSNVYLLIKAILELVGGYGESFCFFEESNSKSKKS